MDPGLRTVHDQARIEREGVGVQRFPAAARRRGRVGLGCLCLGLMLSACSPQALVVRSAADQLASPGDVVEDDLTLAREAAAFHLKLSESVLARIPGHRALAASVAAGFTQYAFAFVAGDADRLEATDARAAQRLRLRAARLYARAHRHAMAALEHGQPGFAQALARGDSALRLDPEAVAVAYWAAASWGGTISLSKDRPDVVADLPQALRLARLAWDLDPRFGDGALASLMGSFELARPDGTRAQAQAYFDQAIVAAAGRSAGPYVAKAESLALADGDRPTFEALLRQALAVSSAHRDLANEVMRERAQWLLDTADDRF